MEKRFSSGSPTSWVAAPISGLAQKGAAAAPTAPKSKVRARAGAFEGGKRERRQSQPARVGSWCRPRLSPSLRAGCSGPARGSCLCQAHNAVFPAPLHQGHAECFPWLRPCRDLYFSGLLLSVAVCTVQDTLAKLYSHSNDKPPLNAQQLQTLGLKQMSAAVRQIFIGLRSREGESDLEGSACKPPPPPACDSR